MNTYDKFNPFVISKMCNLWGPRMPNSRRLVIRLVRSRNATLAQTTGILQTENIKLSGGRSIQKQTQIMSAQIINSHSFSTSPYLHEVIPIWRPDPCSWLCHFSAGNLLSESRAQAPQIRCESLLHLVFSVLRRHLTSRLGRHLNQRQRIATLYNGTAASSNPTNTLNSRKMWLC